MPSSIQCRLIILPEGIQEGKILAEFSLLNKSDVELRILKWGTPLEALQTDCLNVIADGQRIPYDGRMRKRGEPSEKDYITLQPNEIVKREFDITEGYKIPPGSSVEVSFDDDELVISDKFSNELKAKSTYETGLSNIEVTNAPVQFTAPNNISFTLGERHRSGKKKALLEKVRVSKGLKAPNILGGTPTRKKNVRAAHKAAYNLVIKAISQLNKKDDQLFPIWFDPKKGDECFRKVKETFKLIKKKMEEVTITYNITGEGCDEGDYGYTYKYDDTIWLCDKFWKVPANGFSSQAGTVVHEMSHAAAATDDYAYGRRNCKQLAIMKPSKAIDNADSYEFYAESLFKK